MAEVGYEEPLQCRIVVYDLLPPSRLSAVLNTFGTGVYHSSIELCIPTNPSDTTPAAREWAYGGHALAHITGIFAIPSGATVERMPGIRHYLNLDVGPCFGPEWEKVFGPKRRRTARPTSALTVTPISPSSKPGEKRPTTFPYLAANDSSHSTSVFSLSEDPFQDPVLKNGAEEEGEEEADEDLWEDDGGTRDGTRYMTKSQRRAFRIIEQMKKELDEWAGTKYNLLGRNCNTFTDELCWRLTGKRAPAWINRAAWVATTVPCIVPAGWIDDPEEAGGLENEEGPRVVIAPPRADRMDLGGQETTA